MAALAFTRIGSGPPLVLLHGIGMSRRVWDPVVPELAAQFEVVAVDLPGFGQSEPVPSSVEPTPHAMAGFVADLLADLDITEPHVVGNSLGGWVALELAGRRPVRSLTLLSPAGLWRGRTPRYNLISLRATRWLARHGTRVLHRLVRHRLGRLLVLGQTHGRPIRMSPVAAQAAIAEMAGCRGFDATLRATAKRHYAASAVTAIDAPVTVAYGTRDLLLRRRSRRRDQLPAGTRFSTLARCGHVPMADNPAAVVDLIHRGAAPRICIGSPAEIPDSVRYA
jgi:pimeloyl-ACP methyl ester carboxylesterase